jgi:ribosomal protein S18 acetylase RimI-like enzyme
VLEPRDAGGIRVYVEHLDRHAPEVTCADALCAEHGRPIAARQNAEETIRADDLRAFHGAMIPARGRATFREVPPTPTILVRRARPDEADLLTALVLRSKAHWGYDAAFMSAAVPELTLTPDLVDRWPTYVAEAAGEVVGLYILSVEDGVPTLRDLWVEPRAIGTGVGSTLWRHMLGEARAHRYAAVRIESDPYAEGFYAKMGALRIGEVRSKIIEGRVLPLMEVEVTDG